MADCSFTEMPELVFCPPVSHSTRRVDVSGQRASSIERRSRRVLRMDTGNL
jgi:hypothetical protein